MQYVHRATYYFSLIVTGLFLSLTFLPSAQAQVGGVGDGETVTTNPKNRTNTVTASITDTTPPSIPILVAPTNAGYVTDATPTFIWEESTDNKAISHYKLFLNGVLTFDNIPESGVDNGSYTFTISKSGDEYTLSPKNNLSDQTHTWKIQAVDINGNTRDSATWSFILDTTNPSFVITGIGEVTTSISAQDPSTVPSSPIHIETNEPIIKGTSEANSAIQITLDDGSVPQIFLTTSNADGIWQYTLPILPRETTITLDFQITDLAGHIVVLNGVQFIIDQQFIFNTPTPLVPGTTNPGATPTPSPISFNLLPETITASNLAIPIITPKEAIQSLLNLIPKSVIAAIPDVVKETTQAVAPIGSALLAGAIPLTTTLTFASQFGWGISLEIFTRILQAIGLLPKPKPQGIVFDSKTGKPVPFAILNVQKLGDVSLVETLVTTVDGVYGGVTLSPGKYRIEVRHQDFTFPSRIARPPYLSPYEYYLGEVFEPSRDSAEQLYMIPVDNKHTQEEIANAFISWKLIQVRFTRLISFMTLPILIISGLILIYYPTLINWFVFLLYCVLNLFKASKIFKIPNIRGKVIDDQGQPLSNVFVRIITENTNQLATLLVTNEKGEFKGSIPKDKYQVSLTKNGYMWIEDNSPVNFYSINVTTQPASVVAVMSSMDKLYTDLFT